jgi:DNA repair photolyase
VLTASRRTDLVRSYPEVIVKALTERYPPESVHSVVLITKFPAAVLAGDLPRILYAYNQVVAQITITGWGGTEVEPRVPPADQALTALPAILDLVGGPARVRLRVDPLLRLADGRDNLEAIHSVLARGAALGITDFITSFVTPYPKVIRRLRQRGLDLEPWPASERTRILRPLSETAASHGPSLAGCCVPELPRAACIDGRRLQETHPQGLPCRLDKPAGQRELCGCTHAADLGWFGSHPCGSGCLYCYANPRLTA